ncbi:MAG: peptidoglycan-binding domain-containing protein [Actinomycetota bacterium]
MSLRTTMKIKKPAQVVLVAMMCALSVLGPVHVSAAEPSAPQQPAGGFSPFCMDVVNAAKASEAYFDTLAYPSQEMWCLIQYGVGSQTPMHLPAAIQNPRVYTGPVDGIPGINTWKSIQENMKLFAYYEGPVDGIPGPNTYKSMQTFAAYYFGTRYEGPIDGVMGYYSWREFTKEMAQLYWWW